MAVSNVPLCSFDPGLRQNRTAMNNPHIRYPVNKVLLIMILFPFSWIYFSSASHICLLQYVLEFVILSHFRVYDSICQCNYPYHLYRKNMHRNPLPFYQAAGIP